MPRLGWRRPLRQGSLVLVVGGAGYIGTHLVQELLDAGYKVRVLDRLLHGQGPIEAFLRRPEFELVVGDALEGDKLLAAMNGASAVVHLAGLVGDPACSLDANFTRQMNVVATSAIQEAARLLGISRFVFASTCSVYGASQQVVSEESHLNPVSLYARSKLESERVLLAPPRDPFSVTILRFATVFGHSRRPRFDLVANAFTARALEEGQIRVFGGKQWRAFVHVHDLARAVLCVLRADSRSIHGQVFNVGDNQLNMTIAELAQQVQLLVDPIRPVEVRVEASMQDLRNYAVSFEKIQRQLGFKIETTLEAGIRQLVAAYRRGGLGHYSDPAYSNLEATRRALQVRDSQLQRCSA